MIRSARLPFLAAVLALLALPLSAQTTAHAHGAPGTTHQADSAAVAAAVERYHQALASADSAGALALLTADAVILESGGVESRAEYRSHHLQSDIEFARAIGGTRGPVRVRVQGDVAWAISTSTTQGEFRGRQINAAGAELMVFTRTLQGWRIAAIQWSSRNRR
jgi:ketosteroid isomerase-like protein